LENILPSLQPLLLFDLDGTLVETAPDLIQTLNKINSLEGLPALELDEARNVVGRGARFMISQSFEKFGHVVSDARLDELMAVYMDYYAAHIADGSFVFPALEDAMGALKSDGWIFAVCTNKPEHLSKLLLKKLKFDHWFEAICGADTFAGLKPDPVHIGGTIKMAGGDPARSIMIGDSITDINAARGIDIPVIAVDFGYTPVPVSELDPDLVISDFAALPDAVRSFKLM
jgi:phosphoglycolate phosphatase